MTKKTNVAKGVTNEPAQDTEEEIAKKKEVLKQLQAVLSENNAALLPVLITDNSSIRADAVITLLKDQPEETKEGSTPDEVVNPENKDGENN